MRLIEMMMNCIPLKSLVISCLVVMVVVLVKLVVEPCQVTMQVSWCPLIFHLFYLKVCPPDPLTSSDTICSYSWVLRIFYHILRLTLHA